MTMQNLVYRALREHEIDRGLFAQFERRQVVTDCWRREGGAWVIRPCPFVDAWSEADYAKLVYDLRGTIKSGGVVFAAFSDGALKGFASVSGTLLGSREQYADLTSLHVSAELRRRGAGRTLFGLAADWARRAGAKKLYISAHSAAETQAFYRALGCADALEPQQEHVSAEPFDCQLEYVL